MPENEKDYLYENTIAFAEITAQTIYDMAGIDYHVEKSCRKSDCRFPFMMHAIVRFYGMIQGEYILSLREETAAGLIEIYNENMPEDELKELREEYSGFIGEVINAASGQAIEVLKKNFEEPTVLPVHIIYGEMDYPDIPGCSIGIKGNPGTLTCSFRLNLIPSRMAEKLEHLQDELESQNRKIDQLRQNIKQIMEVIPDLNNTVDELFIIQNLIYKNPVIRSNGDVNIRKYFEQLSRANSKLRNILTILWSVPLQQTFEKAGQIAEDISKKFGKSVDIYMSGGETEINRQTDEVILKVFTHIIANCIEYGIESPEERKRLGKPEKGRLNFKGNIRGGYIIISIEDDGRGLNRKLILDRAKNAGYVPPEKTMTDHEIYQLLFLAPLAHHSRQKKGLDEVKTAVEKLKGSVEVCSIPNEKCSFVIRLPVSMSIIEGIAVKINSQEYIIPLVNIREVLCPEKKDYFKIEGSKEIIRLRGDILPLIRLNKLFGIKDKKKNTSPLALVVEDKGDIRCIQIDEIIGKCEVAVQYLGDKPWLNSEYIAGGAITASGKVSLVLDIRNIFKGV